MEVSDAGRKSWACLRGKYYSIILIFLFSRLPWQNCGLHSWWSLWRSCTRWRLGDKVFAVRLWIGTYFEIAYVRPVISPHLAQSESWLFRVHSRHTNLREFQVRSQQRGVCLRTKTDKVLKGLRNYQAFWYWIWSCFTLLQAYGSLNTDSIVAFKLLIPRKLATTLVPKERWDR